MGRGTASGGTSVQPVGTSTPHRTGTTSLVSVWCALEFCGSFLRNDRAVATRRGAEAEHGAGASRRIKNIFVGRVLCDFILLETDIF